MTIFKHLSILLLLITTVASGALCQTSKQSKTKDSTARKLSIFRQVFWDSIPPPVGYVNDYENLYTDTEERVLESCIADFERRTTIQIAVVTFDTTMTTPDNLDALTLRIAKVWGVGQKEKNNGVVIGICSGYRKMRIQNSYGIEKVLSDADTKQIIDTTFIPRFREARYYEGTLQGLQLLMVTLEKRYK